MKSDIEMGREALSASRDKLSKDIVGVANDAADLLKNVAERRLDSAKVALSDAHANLTHEARHAAGSAQHYVRAHPWKAMGAATAAGVVLGLLLARR
jgi:ElaB/YqjD/DUF883 family membrane-anchored ribosome-binding protein